MYCRDDEPAHFHAELQGLEATELTCKPRGLPSATIDRSIATKSSR